MHEVLALHAKRVGGNIRRARRDAGLSHDQLAAAVGTSRQHLIKIEKGQHLPRPDMLSRIAAATGCDPDSLSEDGEEGSHASVSIDDILEERVRVIVHDEIRELAEARA